MKKTQIFLVAGFIAASVLAVGFYTQMEYEKGSRIRAESMLNSVIKENNGIKTEMNKRLKEKEILVSYLSASLSKEQSINSKLARNLERSSRRSRPIAFTNKKPIELEKIVISSLLEAEGKVLAVDRQNDLVVINLGSMNNLRNGDKLSIYRGDSFIASAELIKVQNRISAAMVLPAGAAQDTKVEVNDIVK